MFDVVPPRGFGDGEGDVTPDRAHGRGARASPSDHVVQIDWKLPARLRRPVREQLAKEKRKTHRRTDVVGFVRKPIRTRPVFTAGDRVSSSTSVRLPKRRVFNRGAEHHTGDVYRGQKPKLGIATPPYVGGANFDTFVEEEVEYVKPSLKVEKHSAPDAQVEESAEPFWEEPEEKVFSDSYDAVSIDAEVAKPRKFFSPVSVQIFPRFQKEGSRLRTMNLGVLFVGCILASFLIWNLQGAGKGFAVLSSVESRAKSAFEKIALAQSALAETDFESSEQSFAEAESLLYEARNELTTALAASRHALRIIDVTGTVRSGEEMLRAGEALTRAGQSVSHGIAPLLASSIDSADYSSQTLVDAVSIAQEEFGNAADELDVAMDALEDVDSPFIPDDLSADIAVLKSSIPRAQELLQMLHDEGDTFLYLLGAERDRQYLVLFANNDEIRPVGGFIGTFGLVNIDRGKVESIDVNSVYDPDGQLKEFIAPPDPLLPIVHRWYMRDTNWFVDYEMSARKVSEFFEKEGGPTVDGVILMTPDVIQRLIASTGPITVPGYDIEVTAENFVEVTQGEVTYGYDKEVNRPKQFLADLTPILLNRLFVDDTSAKLDILNMLTTSLKQKDLLLYFRDDDAQKQLIDHGWAGKFPKDASGFLSVNNANIGGHKSDQFIEQDVDYRTNVKKNGDVEVVLTVQRTHHGPEEAIDFAYPDGEDPSKKDNVVYQRVLVPKGAQLMEAHGFTASSLIPSAVLEKTDAPLVADPDLAAWQRGQSKHSSGTSVGSEAGYSFFANWMVTKPGETSVGVYRYVIPSHVDMPGFLDSAGSYSVYVAKQSGASRTNVRVEVSFPKGSRVVHTVPSGGVTLSSESAEDIVYRGALTTDLIIGAVFEKGE